MDTQRRTGMALPLLALLVALAAGGGYWWLHRPRAVVSAPPRATPPTAPVLAAPTPVPAPRFDIVRVDPQGNLVVAGHAAPGATVTIRSGAIVLGTAIADDSGAFAFVPEAPLPAGAQQLALSETVGGKTLSREASAAVMGALAIANNGPGATTVLSGQGPRPGQLGIGAVDYDTQGQAIFSGTAPAGSSVRVAIGGRVLGTATAGSDGTWQVRAPTPKAGMLSVSVLGANGQVRQSDTVPFAPEALPAALAQGRVEIRPGNNLWNIARTVYGRGTLYTTIYAANANQIRNPNLIYPGQNFVVPNGKAP